MKESRPQNEGWVRLLRLLGPDDELAGENYERIRRSLILFFRSRGCHDGEHLADEAFNRAEKRIGQGVQVEADDPVAYFMGIARLLVYEDRRKHNRPVPEPPPAPDHEGLENLHECHEKCFLTLDPDTRGMLIEYCEVEHKDKGEKSKQLAGRLGITVNALRLRVFRIRDGLAKCREKCLKEKREKSF